MLNFPFKNIKKKLLRNRDSPYIHQSQIEKENTSDKLEPTFSLNYVNNN